jgi:hypothetical protein
MSEDKGTTLFVGMDSHKDFISGTSTRDRKHVALSVIQDTWYPLSS